MEKNSLEAEVEILRERYREARILLETSHSILVNYCETDDIGFVNYFTHLEANGIITKKQKNEAIDKVTVGE